MKHIPVLLLLTSFLITSCSLLQMGIEPAGEPTAAQISLPTQAAATVILVQTAIPTETQPVATSPAVPTAAEPSPTSAPQTVKLFFIALEDNGKSGPLVGCGDSAVAVQVEIQPTEGVLRAALEALLANKSPNYGESGLYNALYQSDLHLEKVTIQNGEALVDITGTMQLGGECDDPRVEAQIEQTVMQFSTINKSAITLNGKPLHEALSLK